MRIIAGRFKGRRLGRPHWAGVRPTSDRLRETLFNVLGSRVEGAVVLDMYAGTGALGLEALSRGAAYVVFVDSDPRALRLIADNVRRCGAEKGCAMMRAAETLSRRSGVPQTFDLILLDPPYAQADLAAIVAAAGARLERGGLVVLEHARRRQAPDRAGALARTRTLISGDSALSFFERPPEYIMATDAARSRRGERVAVYPGSFDPLTNGHVDIILRGARLFDRIVVAILVNPEKTPLFSIDERVQMAREVFGDEPRVEIEAFEGLLVDYVRRRHAQVIVRGLRAISDFEYEFQMALMNRRLVPDVETVFMMPAEAYTYTSSRIIREVFALGGSITGLVPAVVESRLRQKFSQRSQT